MASAKPTGSPDFQHSVYRTENELTANMLSTSCLPAPLSSLNPEFNFLPCCSDLIYFLEVFWNGGLPKEAYHTKPITPHLPTSEKEKTSTSWPRSDQQLLTSFLSVRPRTAFMFPALSSSSLAQPSSEEWNKSLEEQKSAMILGLLNTQQQNQLQQRRKAL